MFRHLGIFAVLAASLVVPAAAANGPVGDRDFQCFALLAVAEFAIREQLNDPKTPADQREGLSNSRTALRAKSDWYLGRISTLPPEKRAKGEFERARQKSRDLDNEKFNQLFDGCMTGMTADRLETVNLLLK